MLIQSRYICITSHHLYNTIRDLCNIAISEISADATHQLTLNDTVTMAIFHHLSHDEMIEYESTNIWEFLRVKAFI